MGGRGVSSFSDRNWRARWSNGLGTAIAPTLKEALGDKGKAQGISAAMRESNPLYSPSYREYSENCQRSVVAYELRRRGYRVYAQPTFSGDTMGNAVHVDRESGVISSRWTGAFKGAKPEYVGGRTARQMTKNIESKMAEYGNGARAVLQVSWKSGGGHVFNVERVNGRTVYIDAQVNRRYTSSYLEKRVRPGSVNIIRTDNLRVSDRARHSVTSRRY